MGVGDDFQKFCTALRIPQNTRSTISSRTAAITKRLNKDFWNSSSDTEHSFYSGSYGRETAIRGISDIDLLMILPYETYKKYDNYQGNGQSALLQAVKNSIAATYPTTTMRVIAHGGDAGVQAMAKLPSMSSRTASNAA